MYRKTAYFRFYEELNDFLNTKIKKIRFPYQFKGTVSVKDLIESIGVPHTEVDLILANGRSVNFKYRVRDEDNISVYPVFEKFDISTLQHLRPEPLRDVKFVVDVNLGKLGKNLRMFGFNTKYSNRYTDSEIIEISAAENRIILTRDIGILKNSKVTHGYWVRNTSPQKQLSEILNYFDLHHKIKPFTRCLVCNGVLEDIDKKDISSRIPENTRRYFNEFKICSNCCKIYWKGSHYEKMKRTIYKKNRI
ncbi:MAG: Mut7-C ubiquitin/RNAse domain-containing protein [Victivallales bacterium]|nr:Mut7-C ubiquitin/RNAse domain-containing protein [Victivallales bacterium]